MGLLEDTDEKFPFFFFDNRSLLKLDHAERFENLAELFAIGVEYPPLIPLLERLIRWRPNPLYRAAAWAFKTFIFFCRLEYVRVADVLTWAGRKTGRL